MQVTAASLGQLAVHYRLIVEEDRRRLTQELGPAALVSKPTSFAQLLLRQGLTRDLITQLLAAGAKLDGVRCDNCQAVIHQQKLNEPREYACSQCDSLLLGFRVFKEAGTVPLTHPDAKTVRDEDSDEAPIGTAFFPVVMALPLETPTRTPEHLLEPAADDETTQAYGMVFPVPDAIKPRTPEEASAEMDLLLADTRAKFDPDGETGKLTPKQMKAVSDAKRALRRQQGEQA